MPQTPLTILARSEKPTGKKSGKQTEKLSRSRKQSGKGPSGKWSKPKPSSRTAAAGTFYILLYTLYDTYVHMYMYMYVFLLFYMYTYVHVHAYTQVLLLSPWWEGTHLKKVHVRIWVKDVIPTE